MMLFPIEILNIGFSERTPIENAILFLREYQNTFDYILTNVTSLEEYDPGMHARYRTGELYDLVDRFVMDVAGLHPLIISVINKPLDGKRFANLFTSLQTNKNGRYTGQAIISLYFIADLIFPIPIELYLILEFLSVSMRFVVGKGMIHDRGQDRYCLFHRKTNKKDIREILKEGYISRESLRRINKQINVKQRSGFMRVLEEVKGIANSHEPSKTFADHLRRMSISNPAKLRSVIKNLFNLEEIADLCVSLNIDYDDIAGSTKLVKANELVGHMERRGRLSELVVKVSELRPNA